MDCPQTRGGSAGEGLVSAGPASLDWHRQPSWTSGWADRKADALNETRRFVDLHTHSSASDGSLRPAEIPRLAEAERLAAVALTDHDTTDGLAEARAAAAEFPELRFVGGVEVSAVFSPGTLHVLGLGIDENTPALARLLGHFRAARRERNPRILSKLQAMGLRIDLDDVRAAAPNPDGAPRKIISRLHIAHALVGKGFVASISEAFARYLGDGAPAYVHKERLAAAEVIEAIHAAGGAAVVAHPVQMKCAGRGDLERAIHSLVDVGLDGIEVHHSDHTDEQTRFYLELARQMDLLITGGSDFHGSSKPDARLGRPPMVRSLIGEPWASRWFAGP